VCRRRKMEVAVDPTAASAGSNVTSDLHVTLITTAPPSVTF